MNRRTFLSTSALAFVGLHNHLSAKSKVISSPYGSLISDPKGILDLPKGFSYSVLSETGQKMSDGLKVPGQPDGMTSFSQNDGTVLLIRNHELNHTMGSLTAFDDPNRVPANIDASLLHNAGNAKSPPQYGGTTNLLYDPKTQKITKQFLSLAGTDTNCAGGKMPWGSWITCEETTDLLSPLGRKHGWCFEVKADPDGGLQKAVPLKALGRFRHEAVAYDTDRDILYLTEDRSNGLLYRFIADKKKDFSKGTLQALKLPNHTRLDIRNYDSSRKQLEIGKKLEIEWVTLQDPLSPNDDLRFRGHTAGASYFARGEGIVYAKGAIYMCCTDGGNQRQGQIFRLTPGKVDTLELYLQPDHSDLLTNGDNISEAGAGHLIICEDLIIEHADKTPHLRGITPDGEIYTLARNALNKSEFAGSCWDEPSKTLFVNIQSPGHTLAITGPWL